MFSFDYAKLLTSHSSHIFMNESWESLGNDLVFWILFVCMEWIRTKLDPSITVARHKLEVISTTDNEAY